MPCETKSADQGYLRQAPTDEPDGESARSDWPLDWKVPDF